MWAFLHLKDTDFVLLRYKTEKTCSSNELCVLREWALCPFFIFDNRTCVYRKHATMFGGCHVNS